jgi:ADP-dependent NAD(P)H-hydrate dehydratase
MPTPTDHATSLVTASALREWPLPKAGGSKHDRGHVLVVGGSPSTPGAAMLAGVSALRVGAGVLALAVARSVAGSVAVALP